MAMPDGARLKSWFKGQAIASRRCKIQIFLDSATTPLEVVEMDIGGADTSFSMDIPAKTQKIRLVCLGKYPRPYLACVEMCVVRGGRD